LQGYWEVEMKETSKLARYVLKMEGKKGKNRIGRTNFYTFGQTYPWKSGFCQRLCLCDALPSHALAASADGTRSIFNNSNRHLSALITRRSSGAPDQRGMALSSVFSSLNGRTVCFIIIPASYITT